MAGPLTARHQVVQPCSNTTSQLLGRLLICLFFFASAVTKLQTFDKQTGGLGMTMFGPKLDTLFKRLEDITGYSAPVHKAQYPQILLAYIAAEFMAAALFSADIRFGGWLLAGISAVSSVVLHNFWDYERNPLMFQNELNHFLKNWAIVGGIWYYLATSPGTRYKSRYDAVVDQMKVDRAAELAMQPRDRAAAASAGPAEGASIPATATAGQETKKDH